MMETGVMGPGSRIAFHYWLVAGAFLVTALFSSTPVLAKVDFTG